MQSLQAEALEHSVAPLLERVIERTGYREHLLATLPKWEAEGKIELLMKDSRGEVLLDAKGIPRTKPFAPEEGE